MTTFAQAVQTTLTPSLTANGMATFDRSLDPAVDLFFAIGSSRGKDLTGAFAPIVSFAEREERTGDWSSHSMSRTQSISIRARFK